MKARCDHAGVTHVHAHFGTNAAAVAMLTRVLGGPGYSFTVHGPEEFDAPAALSLGEKIAHGTPFRRAVEEGLLDPKRTIQIGIRGSLYTERDYDYAKEVGADCIVVGTHNRRGLRRLVLGSVAEDVVHMATCPVIVARPKVHERDDRGGVRHPDGLSRPSAR